MAVVFHDLTLQNFLSIGNVPQTIRLDAPGLSLILGENIDVGGAGSRNGVGKSTIIQGLAYSLFGCPITNIKKDNLVNASNLKNMCATITFSSNGKQYKIERGRKPNFIRWYVDNTKQDLMDTDEAQGESKWTQLEIDKVLGFTYEIFCHVVVLSTEVTPFLKLATKDQRTTIEQLLGITHLTTKAEQLKEQMLDTKERIRNEEACIKAVIDANTRIQQTINELAKKSIKWEETKKANIAEYQELIDNISDVDIDAEIANHHTLDKCKTQQKEVSRLQSELAAIKKQITTTEKTIAGINTHLTHANTNTCPTCKQTISIGTGEELATSMMQDKEQSEQLLSQLTTALRELEGKLGKAIESIESEECKVSTFYHSIADAYQHKATLDSLKVAYTKELETTNPYDEQTVSLETNGLQDVDYAELNSLGKLRDHQDFLYKLLTHKNSFVRKQIMDQNLPYLNHRLAIHLEHLNLPHSVKFTNDLGVEISLLGRDYDYEQLSTGERKRVILGLNWAFRDVWESIHQQINLIFVDELLDSGTDSAGVEAAWEVLTKYARDGGKSVYLISHREELISRASNVLKIIKEHGFTTFCNDAE